ncbi:MAG: hypothetical protein V1834_04405 [Candidatus Micrarchaeota archaeon]
MKSLETGRFTLYSFLNACFSFSPKTKELAILILEELRKKPTSFTHLLDATSGKKSSLFLVLAALKQSGLVEQRGRGQPFVLSGSFSKALAAYAGWWEQWKERV